MKTLKEAYKNYFTVGAAVAAHWLDEAAETVKAHFDTVTCENEMKYNSIHPHEYTHPDFSALRRGEKPAPPEITDRERFVSPSRETDFAPADRIYNFAKENGILVRGHTLMWHGSYPWGIFEQLSADEIMHNTLEHFGQVAERYPDCYCWDVVNEAIDDKHGGYLRETVFKEKLGEDYLFEIYALARKYFPGKLLCCNDYNEFNPQKRDSILKLVNALKERGLVDVIGCQCHLHAMMTDRDYDNMRRGFEMYAETGLRIHVTELDVNAIDWKNPDAVPEGDLEKRVTEAYGRIFGIFREFKGAIENVTLWGVSDRHSWLNHFKNAEKRKNLPLLFDSEYNPKEALQRVIDF